jgi:hypothetical protein
MNSKRDQSDGRLFSIAFGIMITSIGLVWFLQTMGLLSENIRVLEYVFPVCIILFGIRIITSHTMKGKNSKQEIMEDYNGRM